mmetsp:Transcript_12176/g.23642  ORF Transcript_12176/g.23642 Transcript_12176/m.23642 type:complete len:650 (-) Transcript_12176:100-2049(-)
MSVAASAPTSFATKEASPRHTAPAPEVLDLQRTKLTAAEWKSENSRRLALRAKHAEKDALGLADDEHRHKTHRVLAGRKKILDEMRQVRDKTHSNLRFTKATARHDASIADRALARAGHLALSARGEGDRWRGLADSQEGRARTVLASAEHSLARTREVSRTRALEAQLQGDEHAVRAQKRTEEHAVYKEQIRERHDELASIKEQSADRRAALNMTNAERCRRDAEAKVRAAMEKSAKEQTQAADAIQHARKEAEAKIGEAKRLLAEKRWECEAAVSREQVCAAQARNIAGGIMVKAEDELQVALNRQQENVARTSIHARNKIVIAEGEPPVAMERNREWKDKTEHDIQAAEARRHDEEAKAVKRVENAKIALGNLQAHCAAYIRELLDQWEAAKHADELKVAAARERTDELKRYCKETLEQCQTQCEDLLQSTRDFSASTKSYLEHRVSAIDEQSKHRIIMMQEQARERRQQAEQRVADLEEHVKDVRRRCKDRVDVEESTAEEKERLMSERCQADVARVEMRTREAEASRDRALQEWSHAVARCRGAVLEANRRGLGNIAALLEEELPELGDEEVWQLQQTNSIAPEPSSAISIEDKFGATASTSASGPPLHATDYSSKPWLSQHDEQIGGAEMADLLRSKPWLSQT